jgi:hypothetical protein
MKLRDYIVEKYRKQTGIDLSSDERAMNRIQEAAAEALIELEEKSESEINLPFIYSDPDGPKHLHMIVKGDWNNIRFPDTDHLVFHKHKVYADNSYNHGLIYLILTVLIIVFSGIMIFILM